MNRNLKPLMLIAVCALPLQGCAGAKDVGRVVKTPCAAVQVPAGLKTLPPEAQRDWQQELLTILQPNAPVGPTY